MTETVLANQSLIRLGCFLGVFALVALGESIVPRRTRVYGRTRRWPGNLAIVALGAVLVRIAFPVAAVGVALAAQQRGFGLLNMTTLPYPVAVLVAVVVLDGAIYLQHVMFHAVPVLWRLHRMHHADLDFDVTTGLRFHPIEILLSMGLKTGVVAALGPPAVAVVIFEVVLNATSLFNHGNLRLPTALDSVLRLIVVTPDMHRVHHSIERHETNSNFGFNLPWWDRLFGTYRAQPEAGHQAMILGIEQFRDGRDLRLDQLLIQPVRGTVGSYPLGRRDGQS